jgi:DNA-binding response OmpR family regulator
MHAFAARGRSGGHVTGKKKVLHVDDDEPTLRLVARFLGERGFAVVSCSSPFIAPVITKESPDVIVMDVDMPLLSGDRIVSIIRGNDFSSIPVIYFSSKPAATLALIAEKSAPSSYVQKDSGLAALLEKIHAHTR